MAPLFILALLLVLGCGPQAQPDPDPDGDGSVGYEDCAPDDANSYPGAPELCDGVDNNCDDLVPRNERLDADGDGFWECQGDCDDEDPGRFPGNPDICNHRDDDCDGERRQRASARRRGAGPPRSSDLQPVLVLAQSRRAAKTSSAYNIPPSSRAIPTSISLSPR